MITLQLTNEQEAELCDNAFSNTNPKIRKKCFIVYLRSLGYSRQGIALIMKVDEDTVTNQVKLYATGGLPLLLKDNYRTPKSQLEPHIPQLKELFDKQPPHTVNQAIDMIEKETGVSLKNSACREFLKKIGLKCRRCGLVPGKAADDEEHQKKQREFHDEKLKPLLEEARQGKCTVLFVDAAHFVMGAFLGMLWCFTRKLLPSASGRKRHNVLGAYDPITHEAITVTNDTYINQVVFCEFLDKIAVAYAGTGLPITVVLDNARYQKCPSVIEKTKELGIHLLYLPPYSPNLNLIERLWRFVKKQVLYSTHYDKFASFKNSIDTCIAKLGSCYKAKMETLMTMSFQFFSKKTENVTV